METCATRVNGHVGDGDRWPEMLSELRRIMNRTCALYHVLPKYTSFFHGMHGVLTRTRKAIGKFKTLHALFNPAARSPVSSWLFHNP